jgi:hypothetical protein
MAARQFLDFQEGFGVLATQNRLPGPLITAEKKKTQEKEGKVLLYLLYCMYQVLYDKSLFYAGTVSSPSADASVFSSVFSSVSSC